MFFKFRNFVIPFSPTKNFGSKFKYFCISKENPPETKLTNIQPMVNEKKQPFSQPFDTKNQKKEQEKNNVKSINFPLSGISWAFLVSIATLLLSAGGVYVAYNSGYNAEFFLKKKAKKAIKQTVLAGGSPKPELPPNYIERQGIHSQLKSVFAKGPGTHIVVGEKLSGKTVAVETACREEPTVIRVTTQGPREENIRTAFCKAFNIENSAHLGLSSILFCIREVLQELVKAKKEGEKLPILFLDDISREGIDKQVLLECKTFIRNLGCDDKSCCVIMTISDAAAGAQDFIGEPRFKWIFIDDFTKREAKKYLESTSLKFSEQQIDNIIKRVGTRPGMLEELVRTIPLSENNLKPDDNSVEEEIVNIENFATESVINAINVLGPEERKNLLKLVNQPYGSTASEADFPGILDPTTNLYHKVLRGKRILRYNPAKQKLMINSIPVYNALRENSRKLK